MKKKEIGHTKSERFDMQNLKNKKWPNEARKHGKNNIAWMKYQDKNKQNY